MAAKIEFFPVDNGDMTLLTLESGKRILIDIHIRNNEVDSEEAYPEVGDMLRDRLERDERNRLYVDAFLISHPDKDHVLGLTEYFHLGPLDDWKKDDDKIVIREMWSSPIVFRRKSKVAEAAGLTLCEDAQNWWTEARRRVKAFRDGNGAVGGNQILILGDDIEDKTDGLEGIRIETGSPFNRIGGIEDRTFVADLLGPLPKLEDEEQEDALAKNRSSVITRFTIAADGKDDACKFLTGGDAEVLVWERLWNLYEHAVNVLTYDVMQTPHHCSLHSISEGSWSEQGEAVTISEHARNALGQANPSARIVASCKPISDDDSDPPCVRAEREYKALAESVNGDFLCTTTHYGNTKPRPLVLDIGGDGVSVGKKVQETAPSSGPIARVSAPATEFQKPSGEGRTYG